MSVEADNIALVRRYVDDVWNKGSLAALDEIVSPNYVQHTRGVPQGRDGLKAFFAGFFASFSNASSTIEDVIADGDRVMWRSTLRATQTGAFRGIPPTGKEIRVSAMTIMRVDNGQFAENWGEQDNLALLRQLGILAQPNS
jgi:steroid delta-isomerase-like uncharacterized protein